MCLYKRLELWPQGKDKDIEVELLFSFCDLISRESGLTLLFGCTVRGQQTLVSLQMELLPDNHPNQCKTGK